MLELPGEMRLLDVFDPDGNRVQLAEEFGDPQRRCGRTSRVPPRHAAPRLRLARRGLRRTSRCTATSTTGAPRRRGRDRARRPAPGGRRLVPRCSPRTSPGSASSTRRRRSCDRRRPEPPRPRHRAGAAGGPARAGARRGLRRVSASASRPTAPPWGLYERHGFRRALDERRGAPRNLSRELVDGPSELTRAQAIRSRPRLIVRPRLPPLGDAPGSLLGAARRRSTAPGAARPEGHGPRRRARRRAADTRSSSATRDDVLYGVSDRDVLRRAGRDVRTSCSRRDDPRRAATAAGAPRLPTGPTCVRRRRDRDGAGHERSPPALRHASRPRHRLPPARRRQRARLRRVLELVAISLASHAHGARDPGDASPCSASGSRALPSRPACSIADSRAASAVDASSDRSSRRRGSTRRGVPVGAPRRPRRGTFRAGLRSQARLEVAAGDSSARSSSALGPSDADRATSSDVVRAFRVLDAGPR